MEPVPPDRSEIMRRIRSEDTRCEVRVRRALFGMGFRFRTHARALPGTPDIVLRKHKTVVLVHGCFWHGHGCGRFRMPGTRTEFWERKIGRNVSRDLRDRERLRELGWRVAVLWECALERDFEGAVLGLVREFLGGAGGGGPWAAPPASAPSAPFCGTPA